MRRQPTREFSVSLISLMSTQWNLWRAEHAFAKTDKAIAKIAPDAKPEAAKAGLTKVVNSATKAEALLSKALAHKDAAKITPGDTDRLAHALASIKDAHAGAQGMLDGKFDL